MHAIIGLVYGLAAAAAVKVLQGTVKERKMT